MLYITKTVEVEQEVEVEIDLSDIVDADGLIGLLEGLNGLGYGPEILQWCKDSGMLGLDRLQGRLKEISSLVADIRSDLNQI